MRLGIDMDGVTFDNEVPWRAFFDGRQGICHADPYPNEVRGWNEPKEVCQYCFTYCCNNYAVLQAGEPLPGAFDAYQYLHRMADLFVITHRHPDLEPDILELFKKHNLAPFVSEYRVGFVPKVETCAKLRLDALIDDSPANIESLAGTGTLPLIFNQNWNQGIEGQRAHGWGDVCRFLMTWRVGGFRNVTPPRNM